MGLKIFLAIALIVICIAGFIWGGYSLYNASNNSYKTKNPDHKKKNKIKGWIAISMAVIMLLAFIFIPFSIHTVDAGNMAVIKQMGKIIGVRESGTNFDLWVTKTYLYYDIKEQNLDIVTSAYSSDAQTMDINMTMQYHINAEDVTKIASEYGSIEALQNRIQSVAIEKTKSVLSSYKAMDIIANRSSMSPEVENSIKAAISENYYVTVSTVVLTNIDFSDSFELAVEEKMIAEQNQLKAQYENQTKVESAQAEADAAIKRAEGEAAAKLKAAEAEIEIQKAKAEAKLIAADADKEAQVIIAKAEAEAIRLKAIETARSFGFNIIETEINNEDGTTVIEYKIDFTGKTQDEINVIVNYMKYLEYLSVWNGELPSVMTDGSASVYVPAN